MSLGCWPRLLAVVELPPIVAALGRCWPCLLRVVELAAVGRSAAPLLLPWLLPCLYSCRCWPSAAGAVCAAWPAVPGPRWPPLWPAAAILARCGAAALPRPWDVAPAAVGLLAFSPFPLPIIIYSVSLFLGLFYFAVAVLFCGPP